jgi:hypothetical protein
MAGWLAVYAQLKGKDRVVEFLSLPLLCNCRGKIQLFVRAVQGSYHNSETFLIPSE